MSHLARDADSYVLFNLLTGPQLLDRAEAQLPEHLLFRILIREPRAMFARAVSPVIAVSGDAICARVTPGVLSRVTGVHPRQRRGTIA